MRFAIIGVVLAIALALFTSWFQIVETGHRGVKVQFGEVQDESLPEGFYVYNPLTSSIEEIDIRTQKWAATTHPYTKDVQKSVIDFTINYNLSATKAHITYKEVGTDWQNKLLPQVVYDTVQAVVGKYEAVDLIANKKEATFEIQKILTEQLLKQNIVVSQFSVTSIKFAPDFETAVENKVVAVQRAIESQNNTRKIEEEAKQRLIAASAEAESMKIRSDALAQSKSLVEYEAVQKWNGVLPQYMLGNAMPMLNIPQSKQ